MDDTWRQGRKRPQLVLLKAKPRRRHRRSRAKLALLQGGATTQAGSAVQTPP